jgi:hypothetical protein
MGRVAATAVAAGLLCAVIALAAKGEPAPSAVARVLPPHYRLLLTEVAEGGRLHVARYGNPRDEAADGPLSVYSVRGSKKPPHEYAPDLYPGDRRTTVRGHEAVLRTLTDEGQAYARELVWRERADLVVAVEADFPLRGRTLRRVAEHVRTVGEPAWARLYLQTSYAARIGHVRKGMRRVRVERGAFDGQVWTLYALVPPHFPLSRDDLRVSCFELRYRRGRGHGDNCGAVPNWQRVGGEIFVFGAVARSVKAVRIRPLQGHAFELKVRTLRIERGPRVRYFATPLSEGTCAVVVVPARHPRAEGDVAAPIRGRDQRRCARASGAASARGQTGARP